MFITIDGLSMLSYLQRLRLDDGYTSELVLKPFSKVAVGFHRITSAMSVVNLYQNAFPLAMKRLSVLTANTV